ncbi:hypothetical protein [Sphingobacterium hotanense]|uniref:hypothetical protein n=1 Tax=Sphingobacterium hotanense TaxID=649196 RepID=UPI0021A9720B|nr:hypothetical protein [Sphingobacterium hotanense]MCT1523857.1 hypothetical protein [Sphingobacterium hotanense]
MNKRITKGLAVLLLLALSFAGCEKGDYTEPYTAFGEVYFDVNKTAVRDYLKVRYNGNPIDWHDVVRDHFRVPEGEGKFEFYDERTGELLFEKTMNIIPGSPEKWMLFQPTETDPIAVLDPNGQADEEAAPEGFMKLKIANYAGDLLSDNLNIVVLGLNMNMETIELATLENISNNLGEEEYRQIPTGGSDILAYTFKFRDTNTQAFLKNHGGDDYWNQNLFLYPDMISPFPEKRVYTIYFKSSEQWGEYPAFIKSGDKYYDINPEILYAD